MAKKAAETTEVATSDEAAGKSVAALTGRGQSKKVEG